ncbi:hypothetical protein [Methylophaga sp.]|jgi:hypothetical protein|nr:hypothetical protein [Methylophaga sp.]
MVAEQQDDQHKADNPATPLPLFTPTQSTSYTQTKSNWHQQS